VIRPVVAIRPDRPQTHRDRGAARVLSASAGIPARNARSRARCP
jgi:hypothetical protein